MVWASIVTTCELVPIDPITSKRIFDPDRFAVPSALTWPTKSPPIFRLIVLPSSAVNLDKVIEPSVVILISLDAEILVFPAITRSAEPKLKFTSFSAVTSPRKLTSATFASTVISILSGASNRSIKTATISITSTDVSAVSAFPV